MALSVMVFALLVLGLGVGLIVPLLLRREAIRRKPYYWRNMRGAS